MENKITNQSQIAAAIIIAGLIIAGAVLLKGQQNTNSNKDIPAKLVGVQIKAVSADEHITGNPKAKIVIVEYSDSECPFCKVFHNTMTEVIAKSSNKVAWVYRHFPIAGLHPKAFNEAVAMECAWAQNGNDSFWKYTNELFARTTSNNRLEVTELPKIATDIGLNLEAFNTCLSTQQYSDKVKADMADGEKAGVAGTPNSFILKNGKIVDTIEGAQPLEVVMQKIEAASK